MLARRNAPPAAPTPGRGSAKTPAFRGPPVAQENRRSFTEWFVLIRANLPIWKEQAGDWIDAVRREPYLLWETRSVRFLFFGILGICGAWALAGGIGLFVPPLPPDARAPATTADFHVICQNEKCGQHFVINREFGFDDFPVQCPACQRETGEPAILCSSRACRGKWIVPVEQDDGSFICPKCNEVVR